MRTPLHLLLLFALALRSLVPVGFMLAASSSADGGALQVVICSGTGEKLMSVDTDGKPLPAKPHHLDSNLCPYAAAGAAAVAAALPAPLVAEARYAAIVYTLAAAQYAATPKPGATSARGPPSILA